MMLGPYKIIDENEASITYQYNSLYSWVLIAIIVVLVAGMFTDYFLVQAISVALVVLYFATRLVAGKEITSKVRQALKAGSVELSGGKYSFSNPLKIKIQKNA